MKDLVTAWAMWIDGEQLEVPILMDSLVNAPDACELLNSNMESRNMVTARMINCAPTILVNEEWGELGNEDSWLWLHLQHDSQTLLGSDCMNFAFEPETYVFKVKSKSAKAANIVNKVRSIPVAMSDAASFLKCECYDSRKSDN